MRKSLPETMFTDPEQGRPGILRTWVLDNNVIGIELKERQYWNFVHLQPPAQAGAAKRPERRSAKEEAAGAATGRPRGRPAATSAAVLSCGQFRPGALAS